MGGVGPVAVATLSEVVGLQQAMLLAPVCYVASGLLFLLAEKEIEQQAAAEKAAAAAAAAADDAAAALAVVVAVEAGAGPPAEAPARTQEQLQEH